MSVPLSELMRVLVSELLSVFLSELMWGAAVGTWRAETVTVECAVVADVGVGVGVGLNASGGCVVINVGACDASARVAYGVNDEA